MNEEEVRAHSRAIAPRNKIKNFEEYCYRKMIIAQLSKKTVTFNEIRGLVIAFMKVGYLTLSSAR